MSPKETLDKFKLSMRDAIYMIGVIAVFWANYQVNQYKIDEQCKRIEALEQFSEKVNVDLINDKINRIQNDLSEIKAMFIQFVRVNSDNADYTGNERTRRAR